MILQKYSLTRSQFDALAREEQVFLAQMLHFLNEIWILQKTVLVSNHRLRRYVGIPLSAQIAQSTFFIKLQAGVLYEAWRTIEIFYGRLAAEHDYDLPVESADALRKLKRYFNARPECLVKYLRQKHAFHCDADRVAEGLNMISRDEPLEVYMAEQGGNFFCPQAELMGNASLLAYIDCDNVQQATQRFMLEVLVDVADMVTTFAQGFCATLLARAGATRSTEDIAIDAAARSELVLSYFMARDQTGEGDTPASTEGAAT